MPALNIVVATPGRLLQHLDETAEFDVGGLRVSVVALVWHALFVIVALFVTVGMRLQRTRMTLLLCVQSFTTHVTQRHRFLFSTRLTDAPILDFCRR